MLSDKQLEDLQKLYKEKFGKDLTKLEALEKGLSLANLMKTILLENDRYDRLENK